MLGFAIRNLLSRRVRSLLALLGLTVAIMGMVGLFSVAAGLQSTIDKTFGEIPGIVVMQAGTPVPLFSKLPEAWIDEIEAMSGVRRVCREIWARANLVEGKTTFSPPRLLFGADIPSMTTLQTAVYRDDMVAGRFLSRDDLGQPVCVVSRAISEEYHRGLGDTLKVDGNRLKIIGIYQTDSILLDVAIIAPSDTVRAMTNFEEGWVSSVYVEPDQSIPNARLVARIQEHFRGRKRPAGAGPWAALSQGRLGNALKDVATLLLLKASSASPVGQMSGSIAESDVAESDSNSGEQDDGLEVRPAREWGNHLQEASADLDLFLVLMTSIGVVIALLSILNTMLMSVTERMIEFGVLRANGWSAGNVISLILAESGVLGFFGGILGCLFGWIGTLILNGQYPSRLNLYASPKLLVFSLIFSTALGMLGGLYPSWWAVRRSPMEAIRRG